MNKEKLRLWQDRLAESNTMFEDDHDRMEERERLYEGTHEFDALTKGDVGKTVHVRNIVFENIESQVDTGIPAPKVTPRRKEDEKLADIIEHFLRNELDRLSFETINDLAERTVPLQGGVGFLTDWDNSKRTAKTIGELSETLIHPKQLAPQPGIAEIEDMDWVIVKIPSTKTAVQKRYGVDISDEAEAEPQIRSGDGEYDVQNEAVTVNVGYAKSDNGIDRYVWVNNVELEDLEDYQARRREVCDKCGAPRPILGEKINDKTYEGGKCPHCGGNVWTEKTMETEEIVIGKTTRGGVVIRREDETGEPTKIPYYKPNVYPIVLQKSVSVYGQLLGNSDADIIKDQQATLNRMEQKIITRILDAGSIITMPDTTQIRIDPDDHKKVYLKDIADKNMIDVFEFTGNLQYEMAYMAQVYEEARQMLGITDSFQGRKDTTATSGRAKEFSAAQAAGRLESKRAMKRAAYAKIFELMFKFWLAYADEPRPISYKNAWGERVYEEFDRYDFLEQTPDGEWIWNDNFLFSCDENAPLANNRAAMWQEMNAYFSAGAFGNPQETETQIMFWGMMENLHYPNAGSIKKHLEEQKEKAEELQEQMQERLQFQQPFPPDNVPMM